MGATQMDFHLCCLGRPLRVLEGSSRTDDYDDAWLLSLAFHAKVIFDVCCNVGQSSLLLLRPDEVEEIVVS